MIRTPIILIGLLVAALGGSDPYCPIYVQYGQGWLWGKAGMDYIQQDIAS